MSGILNAKGVSLAKLALPLVIIVLMISVTLENPRFLTIANLGNIGVAITPVAVVAMGMTMLLISRNFDLSVGGIGALTVVLGGMLLNHLPLAVGLLAIGILGTVCGILNGIIVEVIGVNSLVATLGTGFAFSGMAAVISGSSPVQLVHQTLPNLVGAAVIGVPVAVWVLAAVVGVAAWYLRTVAGRALYAVGANRTAARYAGVPVRWVAFAPFAVTGLFSAIAGIITLGYIGAGLPNTGSDWALEAIAGAVVGGVSIAGGEGSIVGAVSGMALIGIVNNALVLLNINSNFDTIVLGVIIIVAVAADVRVRNRTSALIRNRIALTRAPEGGEHLQAGP